MSPGTPDPVSAEHAHATPNNGSFSGALTQSDPAIEALRVPVWNHTAKIIKDTYKPVGSSQSKLSPSPSADGENQNFYISPNAEEGFARTLVRQQQSDEFQSPQQFGLREDKSQKRQLSERVEGARWRSKRAAISDHDLLWPDGVIPYELDSKLNYYTKVQIQTAMQMWENETCLIFVPFDASHHRYHVIFNIQTCGCCSYVGRRIFSYAQSISIGQGCATVGIIAHEIGHAIGFWHEQSRPDRDTYVDILLPSYANEKKQPWKVDSLGEPYDYDSIMHYSQWINKDGRMVEQIRPKDPNAPIGQRMKLSEGDIKQTNKLYSCPSCGRTLLQPSDKFSSPELPLGKASVCKWRILAQNEERIVLNFIRFHVRPTGGQSLMDTFQSCTDTYVEVRDGYEGNSKSLGRYCGPNIPPKLNSIQSKMIIIYARPAGSPGIEFDAEYQVICGGQVSGTFGTITSPNYPQAYWANKHCFWEITVPVGSTITLSFTSFDLERSGQCENDYVHIFDGPSENESLLTTLCGHDLPQTVSSTANTMTIEFVSDSSVQKDGFSATFQAVAPAVQDRNCRNTEHGCQQKCKDTYFGIECACQPNFELQSDGKSCKVLCRGLLTTDMGEPFFPVKSSSSQCVWKLVLRERNEVIRLTFTEFDLIKEKNCQDNSVTVVRRLENNKTIEKRFCGKQLPPTIISYDELTLVFDVGSSRQPTYFRANYRFEDNECSRNNGDCEYRCYKTPGTYRCQCKNGFELYEKSKCRRRSVGKARQ